MFQLTKDCVASRETNTDANLHIYDGAAIGQRCDVHNGLERSVGERHDVERCRSNRGDVFHATTRPCPRNVV